MSEKLTKFVVLSRTENVRLVGEKIDELCLEMAIPPNVREDVVIAVDEAVTNIMMHSYCGRDDGKIEITCRGGAGELELRLEDSGTSFKMPNLDGLIEWKRKNELIKGGYGLILMHKFMDDVSFSCNAEKGRNILVMKKRYSV